MSPLRLRLQEFRTSLGLTQHELAAKSGVARSRIAELELKPNLGTTLRTLEKLADALGVRPHLLLEYTPPKRRRRS